MRIFDRTLYRCHSCRFFYPLLEFSEHRKSEPRYHFCRSCTIEHIREERCTAWAELPWWKKLRSKKKFISG